MAAFPKPLEGALQVVLAASLECDSGKLDVKNTFRRTCRSRRRARHPSLAEKFTQDGSFVRCDRRVLSLKCRYLSATCLSGVTG